MIRSKNFNIFLKNSYKLQSSHRLAEEDLNNMISGSMCRMYTMTSIRLRCGRERWNHGLEIMWKVFFFFFLKENFNLWRLLLMAAFFHHPDLLFNYQILPIKLTRIHVKRFLITLLLSCMRKTFQTPPIFFFIGCEFWKFNCWMAYCMILLYPLYL